MTITELIAKLEEIKAERSDLNVVVEQYTGGDDELFDVMPLVNEGRAGHPVVLVYPYGRY